MENHLILDSMISKTKKGKKFFSVDKYAEVELFPSSIVTKTDTNPSLRVYSVPKTKGRRSFN